MLTDRTIGSMDEHIYIDVIGDYAKLLGREKHQHHNANYTAHSRKLIQTNMSFSLEPKVSTPIKNPFTIFEMLQEEFKESDSSRKRSNSEIKRVSHHV